jgi:hypothetical protein
MSTPMRTFTILHPDVAEIVIAVFARPSSTVMITPPPPARTSCLVLRTTGIADAVPAGVSMVLVIIVSALVRFLFLMLLPHLEIRFIVGIDPPSL